MKKDDKNIMPLDLSIVYQEQYNEMRRYRDMQHDYGKWYTNITLATFAGLVALNQSSDTLEIVSKLKPFMYCLIIFITLVTIYEIFYMDRRYSELKKEMKQVEPSWFMENRKKNIIKPPHLISIRIISLAVVLLVAMKILI